MTGYEGTVALIAQAPPQPDDPGGRGEDFGKAAPVGLLLLILFFVAVAFLARSMNKHLRRVPASFDKPAASAKPEAPAAGEDKQDD